ncbi:MAG TPA: amylo-alpha-1,6-glucosidase [Methanotrichaceae archaeon]|nr:amylo-alpha-1,6-glucosidase [Methanotrichaceae archaeon]
MNGFTLRPEGYETGASREWLVANGLGGYASSTAVGANTRAYHGLLVAALSPPTDRRLLLASLDEEINSFSLGNHQYPGTIHPQGFRLLQEFGFDPLPRFAYHAGDSWVDKTVFMVYGENTTIIRYRVEGHGRMRLFPLVHSRNFHAAAKLPATLQEPSKNGVRLKSDSSFSLLSDKARYVQKEQVYYNFEYEAERRRGLSWKEDLFCPGYFEIDIENDIIFSIMASTWRRSMPDVEEALEREVSRLRGLKAPIRKLAQAADTFVVRRGHGKSIIAGYHWFDDWGRDAMVSLPGLLLTTGRFEDARLLLRTFAAAMKEGNLPNDLGAESYNTVDASLWFIQSVGRYYDYSKDMELVRQLWPQLQEVIRRYSVQGKDFGMDSDGLISAGPALTWMDARVDGKPVTPRAGKACEINALWYTDLKTMERLAEAMGMGMTWDKGLSEKVKKSYQRFWNSETGCLYDVLDPEDASIRPNQIIAAAVPDLLHPLKRRSILEVVTRELLTPYGLRTLSPRDPRYIGRHEGEPRKRDGAYHQGTVWPWLIGPYVDALLSINDYSQESKEKAREVLRPLAELDVMGINTIPEVFDGDFPHLPGGTISQAWSVAEVLRAWDEASGK